MSLDIRIDGRSVDLLPAATLTLKLTNPHFDFERIVGQTANLPMLPLTPRNQQIFGFWEQPQADTILSRRTLAQYYNGHLIREAEYLLTEAGPGGYGGQMVEALGDFFGPMQNTLLTEIEWGTLPLPSVIPIVGIAHNGERAVVFPTILNPDYYGTEGGSIGYSGRMNPFENGVYQANGPMVPMIMLRWLLHRIALASHTTIDGDFIDDPIYRELLLYNTRALDGAQAVKVRNHLPSLTVAELILEVRKLFCLKLDFDVVNRRLSMNFMADTLTDGEVVDWSAKWSGAMTKQMEVNRRLKLGYDLDGGDALMKDKPALLADYETATADRPGTGANFAQIRSKFSTLLTDNATYLAQTAQPGITDQFGQGSNSFAPRLLFWNIADGLPKAHNGLASCGLYWTGLAGLYANHWRPMDRMRQGQFYAKGNLNLTEADLAGLRWDRRVHINGVNYFVLSLDATLPIRKATPVLLVAA